jgi:transcriptional regulator with XRE-family HTH domain
MVDRIGVELGRRLRQLRAQRGLTQAQFAELTRKSVETISNFERGQTLPSVQTLAQISKVLNISIAQLFDDKMPPLDPKFGSPLATKISLLSSDDKDLLLGMADLLHARAKSPKKRKRSQS